MKRFSAASFHHKNSYAGLGGAKEKLLAQLNIPDFVSNRTCTELNGYFGSRTSSNGKGKIESCSTWFRCLVKMVPKVGREVAHESGPEYVQDGGKYIWYEMSFFTRWDYPDQCRILCIDTPEHLGSELQTALAQQPPLDFRDPLVMHRHLVDQIIVLYDISVWRVRDPVRQIERSRKNAGQRFDEMHEMARHGIHVSEVLEASIQTLEAMQSYQAAIHNETMLSECYRRQANEYAKFQLQCLRSLKLRSQSNDKRLENEINLAFNSIAHSDNTVMKSITILTMSFLPATFISVCGHGASRSHVRYAH
ncbi:hypothetical protein DL767_003418 [Monosporascus sp. MG133]|nr:hypothetical protein DL767_003418 [Monosporascus sp. MG133]